MVWLHRAAALGLLVLVVPGSSAGWARSWTSAAALHDARYLQTATLLGTGQVLIAGGGTTPDQGGTDPIASAELYDPAADAMTSTGSLSMARYGATATLLGNGKVLVAGGVGADDKPIATAELYDPASGTWSSAGAMGTARAGAVAVQLGNGKVLVAGGSNGTNDLGSAELYDPAANSWAPTGSMFARRDGAVATPLADGRALVIFGSDGRNRPWNTADVYDPASGSWSRAGSLDLGLDGSTATLLASGKVLVAGGSTGAGAVKGAELYDPASNAWTSAASMNTARVFHTATLLSDGRVLVAGGQGEDYDGLASEGLTSAELYDPASNSWSLAGTMRGGRWDHTATLLPNGKVLVVGGRNEAIVGGTQELKSDQLYTPGPGEAPKNPPPTFPPGPVIPGGPLGPLTPVTPAGSGSPPGPVVLAPSARRGTCVYKTGHSGIRPFGTCARATLSGAPVFAPDGRMVYMHGAAAAYDAVFSRNPSTGTLARLPCQTSSGGTRCPPGHYAGALAISPDGRWLYTLNGGGDGNERELYVFSRAADGTLSAVRCLGDQINPDPGCEAALPGGLNALAISPDFTSLYLVGGGLLLKLDRDPSTGVLSIVDHVGQLGSANQIAVAGDDVYVYSDEPSGRPGLYGFRPDPQTGRLVSTGHVSGYGLSDVVASPDGLRLYAVPTGKTELLAFARDPSTGQLGAVTCSSDRTRGLEPVSQCRGASEAIEAVGSVAVSPDGRTAVTTGTFHTGCNHCATFTVPGGQNTKMVTYRMSSGGRMRSVGCVGDVDDCAPPIGTGLWLGYPPNGAGPYFVSSQNGSTGIQILEPAPTLRVGRMSLTGANRASITCPRTRACHGRIRIDLVLHSLAGSGFESLQRESYRLPAGATRRISLRLDSSGRRRMVKAIHKLAAVGPAADVFLLVRVFDGTGRVTPTGASVCLSPSLPHVGCAIGEGLE